MPLHYPEIGIWVRRLETFGSTRVQVLVVMPIIAGEERRLFEGVNLPEKYRLKLAESKTFESGSVALSYLKQ